MMKGQRDFIRTTRAIQRVYRHSPTLIGGLAVQFSKDSFRRQGWLDDGGLERWAGRKARDKNRKRRNVGIQTGRLRRSPRVLTKTRSSVWVGTDVPYARRFNEGYTGTVNQSVVRHNVRQHRRKVKGRSQVISKHERSAHTRTMKVDQPARPFIGESDFLNRRMAMNIEHELRKELRFLKNI